MALNQTQIELINHVWKTYIEHGEKFVNARKEYTNRELDQRRQEVIPEIKNWIRRFLGGDIPLEEFKTGLDGINKRNRLWGFHAINGQMFFNVLVKNSIAAGRIEEFAALLKKSIIVPDSLAEAKGIIEKFSRFTRELAPFSADPRGAPKVGSVLFFLSYFWQIQQPEIYPVYYTSMVGALSELDIWWPSGEISEDYDSFYNLNRDILELLSKQSGDSLTLWDVEHAFWFQRQLQTGEEDPSPAKGDGKVVSVNKKGDTAKQVSSEEPSESYIPPVVALLPRIAKNDEALSRIYESSGRTIERVFEEKLAVLFKMLGYETQLLGQGQGRAPDGVAISLEFRYAIIYDAKVRQNPYTMGVDERAIREYIAVQGDKLRKQGVRNLYFMVVSSAFTDKHDDAIRTLKIDTNVNEVLLVEAKTLLVMLEGKLRNPAVTLGPDGLQRLFAFSGLLFESDVREFLEV